MSLLVVSDLHIHGPEDRSYGSLLRLLNERAAPGDTVVLAGDLFDLFVGDKAVFTRRYSGFFEAIRGACGRGAQVHYIEGNHDFFMRRAFRGVKGVQVHPHHVTVELAGKKFFFAHGDTVDRSDIRYLFLRGLLRSPVMKALVRALPGVVFDRIGRASAQASRNSRPNEAARLPLKKMEELRVRYRNYAVDRVAEGYDFVVMGHCHDLDEMTFVVGERPGQYVNVGYPPVHGSFLAWQPGEEKIHREKLPG